jgi:hypothetical protein
MGISKTRENLVIAEEPLNAYYRLIDGRGYVRVSSDDHSFDEVLSIGLQAKQLIRTMLRKIMGGSLSYASSNKPSSTSKANGKTAEILKLEDSPSENNLTILLPKMSRLSLLHSSENKSRPVSPASPLFRPPPSLDK